MAVEVDELYFNLNKLLNDICKFLSDGGNYEKLSHHARYQADELIKRSKLQLQEIEKLSNANDDDGAYVDMEKKPGESNDDDDKNNIYSSVDEAPTESRQTSLKPFENPYANLPAKSLSHDIKYGSLSWKCRIILKFEKIRRIYAGVHHNWFLIYSSEKDTKPIHTFDLKYHKAHVVLSKNNKNPPQDFELVSSLEGKSYYFLALTHKDMLQWISHINRCYDHLNKSENLYESEESLSETYTRIPEKNEEDDEDLYHNVDTYFPQRHEIVNNKPPDLPARRCLNQNIPSSSTVKLSLYKSSKESLTYDDSSHTRGSVESASFSEDDDEDTIYQPFVWNSSEKNRATSINELSNNDKSSNVKTGTMEKPPPPLKPKIFKETSKNIVNLKK